MKRTMMAYFAGVIDSDGTIGIKRSTYKMRVTKDCKQATYSERICLKQVEPQAVRLLLRYFGGASGIAKPSAANGRPLFYWQVTDKKAAIFLRAVIPHLRIKKRQAANCLRLRSVKEASKKARVAFGRGHAGSAARPEKFSRMMERLLQKAHSLNSVGT